MHRDVQRACMPEALFFYFASLSTMYVLLYGVRTYCRAFSVGGTYAYAYALQVGTVYNVVFASTKLRLDRAIIGIGTSLSRDSPTRDEIKGKLTTLLHAGTQPRTDASCHPRSALPDQRRRRKGAPRPRLSATAPPRQRVNEGLSISGTVHHYYWSTLPCM
jgi:hypothetical protein